MPDFSIWQTSSPYCQDAEETHWLRTDTLDFCKIVDYHSGVDKFYAMFHFQTQSKERGDLSYELKHGHGYFQNLIAD